MRLRLFRPQRNQGDTEAAHPVALLRARRERPRRRAAEQRDDATSASLTRSPRWLPG
jgi:hypothetical protein